jgi:Family of unknown function (DUF6232)
VGCELFQDPETSSESSESRRENQPQPGEHGPNWPGRLLRDSRIVISLNSISVDGRQYQITRSTIIEAVQRGPTYVAALLSLMLGTVGIPATIVFNRVTPDDYSWLVGFPVAFVLGAILRVLTAEATYAVVLVSDGTAVPIVESRDYQLVISLVAALRDAKAVLDVLRTRASPWSTG